MPADVGLSDRRNVHNGSSMTMFANSATGDLVINCCAAAARQLLDQRLPVFLLGAANLRRVRGGCVILLT